MKCRQERVRTVWNAGRKECRRNRMRLEYNAPEIQWRTEMKVVILAGGLGTRISEESHLKPKPMIEIG